MDCHTADSSAAGIINPKYLQTEPAFSFSSWEQPRYESVSEWITNQDPNSPADFLDPNSLHDSLSDDLSDIPLLDQSGGLMSANFRCAFASLRLLQCAPSLLIHQLSLL